MIRKTRRKLVWGYTLAIIAILIISTLVGIFALNRFTNMAMERSLLPELEAEMVESRPVLRDWHDGVERTPRITHFDSHELAFTVMEYWFSTERELVMAEGSQDVSDLLMERIQYWNRPNLEIEELKIYDDDGKEWEFIVIADDVYDDDGTYLGKVIVGTNMTPLTRINRQYMQAAAVIIIVISVLAFFVGNYFAAKAIEPIAVTMQKQRNFVADASHELRTPLSVMLASVDMLEPSEANRQIVDDMRAEIMNMRSLINSLLSLARSDSNKDELDFCDFDLSEIAQSVARNMQHLANTKNIKLVNKIQPGIILYADEIRIRQLLNILLDNAIKYSADNMVVLFDIRRHHHHIDISVQDYGAGIAQDDLANIFERFYRADKARSRGQGGFGLGLSIARLIVEKHGGEIKVESEPGRGSVFTVTLPLKLLLPFKPRAD